MVNFKFRLLKKITTTRFIWQIAGDQVKEIALSAIANTPQEIEKINHYLNNLNSKGKKLGLTNLEKIFIIYKAKNEDTPILNQKTKLKLFILVNISF